MNISKAQRTFLLLVCNIHSFVVLYHLQIIITFVLSRLQNVIALIKTIHELPSHQNISRGLLYNFQPSEG